MSAPTHPDTPFEEMDPTQKRIALRGFLAGGWADEEIADETGWDIDRIRSLKEKIEEEDQGRFLGKRSEDQFSQYTTFMLGCIRELDGMIRKLEGMKQGNAMVNAVRFKADLFDRIIAFGQQLGFIYKAPETKRYVISGMGDHELEQMTRDKVNKLNQLMGDDQPLLDVKPTSGKTRERPQPKNAKPGKNFEKVDDRNNIPIERRAAKPKK